MILVRPPWGRPGGRAGCAPMRGTLDVHLRVMFFAEARRGALTERPRTAYRRQIPTVQFDS